DFGQLVAGRARIKLQVPDMEPAPKEVGTGSVAPTEVRHLIRINYSEAQNPPEVGFLDPTPKPTPESGERPVEDLDLGNQLYNHPTDYVVLRPGDTHWCESKFTRYGFRYLEIIGIDKDWIVDEGPVGKQQFVDVIHSDIPYPVPSVTTVPTVQPVPPVPSGPGDVVGNGTFYCSNHDINLIMDMISRTMRSVFQGYPTATIGRGEKVGFADMGHIVPVCAFDREVVRAFSKWVQDHRDHQTGNGGFAEINPFPPYLDPYWYWTPAWSDVSLNVCMDIYQFYGDEKIIDDHYDSAKRFVEGIKGKNHPTGGNDDFLWDDRIGHRWGDWNNADQIFGVEDWYSAGGATEYTVFATEIYAKCAQQVSDMAAILGLTGDKGTYQELANNIRKDFVVNFVDTDVDSPDYGRILGDSVTSYAFALEYGLLVDPQGTPDGSGPSQTVPGLVQEAQKRIVDKIYAYDFHLPSGFIGTESLMGQLASFGRSDLAYEAVLQRDIPSWIYMLENGATTIWESWQSISPGVSLEDRPSALHATPLGRVGNWIHRNIVGMNPDTPDYPLTSANPRDQAKPGFKRFTVRPRLGGNLSCAKGFYNTVQGPIEVHWWIEDDAINKFHLKFNVPIGTEALVYVTAEDEANVNEGEQEEPEHSPATESEYLFRRPDLDEENRLAYEVEPGNYHFVSESNLLFPDDIACGSCGQCAAPQ
ncbi:MAG: hypothetical protein KC964_30035, partial [Candidatus Omnitrophica bacterium]|nr:hypothetical protein [Candidatus Omnitrophota bacterium]